MLVDVIFVDVMKVAIVKIICMTVMTDCHMPALRIMDMRVPGVFFATGIFHGFHPPKSL